MIINILESIKLRNNVLFYFGLFAMLGAITTFILLQKTSVQINGINAYYKPMKFFISIFIFVWSLAFYMQFLENQKAVKMVSWIAVIGLGYELLAITLQAARGTTSHYNHQTTFDLTITVLMAVAISVVMFSISFIAVQFFTQKNFNSDMILIWSIRMSLLITVVFAFEGFIMGSLLKHTIGATDGTEGLPIVNWSKKYGDLRVAHFFGIHAIQIVPFLSYSLAKSIFQVFIIATVYLLLTTYALVRAMNGKPLV